VHHDARHPLAAGLELAETLAERSDSTLRAQGVLVGRDVARRRGSPHNGPRSRLRGPFRVQEIGWRGRIRTFGLLIQSSYQQYTASESERTARGFRSVAYPSVARRRGYGRGTRTLARSAGNGRSFGSTTRER